MPKHTLCLYTANFPYGYGEQFIETEIEYLANSFRRVVIIPNNKIGEKRPVPTNVEVLYPNFANYSTLKGIKNLGWWFLNCIRDVFRNSEKSILLSALLRAGYNANELSDILIYKNLLTDTLHYTYWFSEQSMVLAILKSKQIIEYYVTRAHGYDLYEERSSNNKIPFRNFQLKQVDKVFLISNNGLNYISNKYPQYQNKFHLSYLGVKEFRNNVPEAPKNNEYTIVSCSRLVPLKRVELLIKGLAEIKSTKINWVHFGDGPLNKEIRDIAQKILPENITATFKGHVDNIEIYNFYNCNYIDCFVNTSSMEGLPVTFMEAISFGIPIIACDVNAVKEIVNKRTGLLISPDSNAKEISEALIFTLEFYARDIVFRESVHSFWYQHFRAEINYKLFINNLNEINL